ncbi:MAG: SH3 domain-containing protein [Planctomycetaceae bacterium]|jgi:hypothetical protein|nr:SH3 domain-containing protein [Planctomycetaceae bacterium]
MLPQTVLFASSPVVGSIIVQKTEVRSGPDMLFYPTSELKFGDQVEIYFETNNWCAIRPPAGSFSWVSARYVSLGTGNIGVVLTAGLASLIGSELTGACDTIQVKLKRGEKILILGKKETPENLASPVWFKISPPSGEYRWIPRAAIDPNFRYDNSYSQSKNKIKTAEYVIQPSNLQDYKLVLYDESEPKITTATPATNQEPPPLLLPPSEQEEVTSPKNRTKNESRKNSTGKTVGTINHAANNAAKNIVSNSANTNIISVTKNTPRLQFDNVDESSGSVNVVTRVANVAKRNYVGRGLGDVDLNFQRIFDELQSETVAALTGQTDDWVFVTLIEEANRLYESAQTDTEMEKVYHIIESLKRGRAVRQDIAARRQNKNTVNNQTATTIPTINPIDYQPNSPITTAGFAPIVRLSEKTPLPTNTTNNNNNNPNTTTVTLDNTQNQFDVSGKLGMFKPLPLKHPPFAVVDDDGQIICLLTPESGIDLRQYVGKLVGVNGIRGIYRKSGQQDSQHITVKTIAIIKYRSRYGR